MMEWKESEYGHTLELSHGGAFTSSDDASGWGVIVDGRDVDNYMHFHGTCSTLQEAKAYAEALLETAGEFDVLKNLPVIDWDAAPPDAVCHANDWDGRGFFYDFVPSVSKTIIGWSIIFLAPGVNMPPFNNDDWKRTLQIRPGAEVKE